MKFLKLSCILTLVLWALNGAALAAGKEILCVFHYEHGKFRIVRIYFTDV